MASYSRLLEAGELNQESLLHALLDSQEYAQSLPNKAKTEFWHKAGHPGDRARALQEGPLTQMALEDLLGRILPDPQDMVIGQEDYQRTHKRRFLEIANAVLQFCPEQGKLLEFGVSEFSRIYKELRPNCRLITSDRPVDPDSPGFTPDRCRKVSGCEAHVVLDLEDTNSPAWHELAANGPFDLILFTEVLEHLLAEPASLLRRMLGLLSSQGLLYLTTPNFLRLVNRRAWSKQLNPQPVFPGREKYLDAHCHYHFREYTMREILELMHGAGGRVLTCYFSGCWDKSKDHRLQARPELRSCLVLLARRNPA